MLKLFKNISVYTIGGILNKSLQFLLLPLYTHILVPADYGKLELVYMVGAVLAIVYGFMIESGYSRIYFDKDDRDFRRLLFSTGQVFNLMCSISIAVISFFYAAVIAKWLFGSKEVLNLQEGILLVRLISVSTLLKVMTHIPYNNLRVREKPRQFVSVNVIVLLINVAFTVFFVAFLRTGVKGVLMAQVIGGTIELTLLYIITRKEIKIGFSYSQMMSMLKFSVFLILPTISSFILHLSNRYFLKDYQSLNEVGLYSLGYKISSIIPILMTEPVKLAFGPYLYSFINDPVQAKRLLRNFTRYFLAMVLTFAFMLAVFSRELIMIMSAKSYYESYSIVFILSLSYVFLGMCGIIVYGIQITKQTWLVSVIWPITALCNIGLNLWLIPTYGKYGASTATMISFLLILIAYFIAVHKVYRVDYQYHKFIYLLAIAAIFFFSSTYITFGVIASIGAKIVVLLLYVVAVYFSGYFEKNELAAARTFAGKLLTRIHVKS